MGVLDILKNKKMKKIEDEKLEDKSQKLPFDVDFKKLENGNIQIEFYDNEAEYKQFYDTTRLVVSPNPLNIAGREVLNCAVSHYGENDGIKLGPNGEEIGRKNAYKGVLAQIDLNLMQTDPSYCYAVMKNLLNEKRVQEYLSRGLQENPSVPCGKYVGGVRKIEGKYQKFFDEVVGRESHYSNLMINRRNEIREQRKNQIERQKQEYERKLQELQDESERI